MSEGVQTLDMSNQPFWAPLIGNLITVEILEVPVPADYPWPEAPEVLVISTRNHRVYCRAYEKIGDSEEWVADQLYICTEHPVHPSRRNLTPERWHCTSEM